MGCTTPSALGAQAGGERTENQFSVAGEKIQGHQGPALADDLWFFSEDPLTVLNSLIQKITKRFRCTCMSGTVLVQGSCLEVSD